MTADVKIDTFTLLINLYFSIEYIILLLSLHHPGPQIRKCINIWNKERVKTSRKMNYEDNIKREFGTMSFTIGL